VAPTLKGPNKSLGVKSGPLREAKLKPNISRGPQWIRIILEGAPSNPLPPGGRRRPSYLTDFN